MAQRGAIFRREAKLRIIEYLIGRTDASPSEIAEAIGVSRVTVSSLIDELVESNLLRRQSDRSCSLLTSGRAAMLRMGFESAEIITFDLCGEDVQRVQMRLIASMSYTDNAARLLSIAERHAAEISAEGCEPYCAVICYGELSQRGIPKSFDLFSGKELLARGLSHYDGALLYLDAADRSSYLLLDGRTVASGRISEKVASEMRSALGLIKPQMVMLAGADEATRLGAENAALFRGAEFSFISPSELRPDERAALLMLMEKRI
jgi:DNA-binding MarR family transcriptional regulator